MHKKKDNDIYKVEYTVKDSDEKGWKFLREEKEYIQNNDERVRVELYIPAEIVDRVSFIEGIEKKYKKFIFVEEHSNGSKTYTIRVRQIHKNESITLLDISGIMKIKTNKRGLMPVYYPKYSKKRKVA